MQSVFRISQPAREIQPTPATASTEPREQKFFPRRSHKKSRYGCGNCKRRQIKCDETLEGCKKCRDHRIQCDFLTIGANGRSVSRTTFRAPPTQSHQACSPLTTMLSFSPSLNSKTLENLLQSNSSPAPVSVIAYITPYTQTLQHFNSITSTTVGSLVAQRIFKASVLQMAMSHPYLMHATLAVSAAHLSYLFPASSHPKEHQRNALAVAYHWKSSLKLFRAELNSVQGIRAHNMDPLLSTCMLLAIYSFSLQESTQDSFVYVDTYKSPGTLGWLTAQSGFKGLLIELSEHLNESVWLPVLTDADIDVSTESGVDVNAREDLIADLKDLCKFSQASTPEINPYHDTLNDLLPLLRIGGSLNNFNKLITFMGRIRRDFLALLSKKDPCALLILAFWLALMLKVDQWWITDRSRAECIAIVTFLKDHPDCRIQRLLRFPANAVGLAL